MDVRALASAPVMRQETRKKQDRRQASRRKGNYDLGTRGRTNQGRGHRDKKMERQDAGAIIAKVD